MCKGVFMKTKNTDYIMQNKVFAWLALVTLGVLLVPLIAMQFTSEVQWGREDFIVIGALLFGVSSAFVLIARNIKNGTSRVLIGIACLALILYLWAELAVGIFTNWGS